MATSKQPTFPDPALEVGIAQYPTPNVPDYYTRDGHIILVEKVSIEKGNYNPQPLDGSVKYAKRDANDWPDDLYLVFQQTEPTGKFVFNYWANDRTLASQDPWNYGISYSLNHPDYKIVTRTYITPREDYAPVALNAVDPVFGGNAIIAKQQIVELPDDNPLRSRYVQVQRVYETIPSSVITGKRLTERGDIETLDTQIVVAGTEPDADGLLVTQTSIEAIDAVKSKRTVGSVESYSLLTTKAKRAGLLGEVDVSDNIVDPATEPDDLTTSIIDSTVEAISATKSRKRTTTSSGPTSLTAKKISERGDTQTITKTIVAASTGVTADSLTLVSSQVDEIDLAKSQKTDVTVSSYSTLTTKSNKAGLLGNVSITDNIVAPSTNPDALSLSIIDSSVEAISATKSRKRTTTASGPNTLSGKSERSGLLGSTTTTETIVAAGASADALTLTRIQSEITPIDSAKSKKTTVESTGPTQLDGKTIGEFGLVSLEQSIVSYASELPTPTENTIDLKKEPIDLAKAKLIESSYDSPEVLNGYQYDADLDLIINNTKEIISEGAAPLSPTNGLLAYTDTPINAWKSIRIQSKITSLPTARTEYKTGAYSSPNLITGFNTSSVQMPNWDISVNVTPTMRAKRSYQTVFKNVTSYQYGQPNPSFTLYDPISVNVYYDGYFFKMNIPDALTNSGISVSFTTASNDPVHGYVNETFNVPASTESASAYEGKIGSYQLIAFEVDYWKANIWRMVEQYVLLK
jgi:hypothetical protein